MVSRTQLEYGARSAAYALLGLVGTAAVVLVVLLAAQPLQPLVYDLFYLQVGPSEATETAILAHFFVAAIVGLAVPTLLADYVSDRWANRRQIGLGLGAMVGLLAVFLLVALAGLAAFLTAILALGVGLVGVPLALRFRYGVRSGALPAFVGGVPVVVFFLLLAGFGIGWGWGYVVTAEEVPESTVSGPVADFADAPEVGTDLLVRGDCETTTDDRRRCHLFLRGYDHEVPAVRFMARHGVRCPYQNDGSGYAEAFIAEYGDRYYRLTCSPHGD